MTLKKEKKKKSRYPSLDSDDSSDSDSDNSSDSDDSSDSDNSSDSSGESTTVKRVPVHQLMTDAYNADLNSFQRGLSLHPVRSSKLGPL